MLSTDVRRVSKPMSRVWVVLAFAFPSTAFPQPDAQQQKIQELLQRIQDIESHDANSEELIDPLTTLGRLYRDDGDAIRSAAATRRAVEVLRFNKGLHTLDQAPLIRSLIGDAEAIGDPGSAWELEQVLLTLAGRHPDDPRTARILRETADRRVAVLDRYIAGEIPPEIELGCYYHNLPVYPDAVQNCHSGTRDTVKFRLLYEAQTLYSQAVNVLVGSEHSAGDEVQTLLEDLARTSYRYENAARQLFGGHENAARRLPGAQTAVSDAATLGRRSLAFLLDWQANHAQAWSDRMETLVEIADWDLLHSNSGKADEAALKEYMDVYELLLAQGARESIDQLFSPDVPIVLPTFVPNPLVSDREQRANGYIDVAFEIDQYGKSRHVRILSTTTDPAGEAKKRLVQLISRSLFRPRVVDGRFAESAPVVVRYYFE